MEDDWDLQAIVRSYTATISATAAAATTTSSTTTTATSGTGVISCNGAYMTNLTCSSLNPSMSILRQKEEYDDEEEKLPCLPVSSFETRKSCSAVEELHGLYKPFFADSSLSSPPVSPLSIQKRSTNPLQQQLKQSCTTKTTHSANSSTRSKRRKNQMKKVFQVPAEGLASDTWSWRKYGQKPIKGSPYPRGYYRCSSLKGCLARKQVERNRTDPTMFIITYTAEHNHPVPEHRNSLAGTTRYQKQPSSPLSPSIAVESSNVYSPTTIAKPSSGEIYSQNSVTKLETRSELDGEQDGGDEDGEDEEHGFSDMAMSDDFFDGLDEIAGPAMTADFFTDNVPASFVIPWMANNAAAAAAGSS